MPAEPADIQRATRQARIVTEEDPAIKLAYPNARDSLESPQPGYCENANDAVTVLGFMAALIGVPRQRYTVLLADEVWIDPLTGIPTFHLVDAELGADLDVLVTRVEIDMENETTGLEVMG